MYSFRLGPYVLSYSRRSAHPLRFHKAGVRVFRTCPSASHSDHVLSSLGAGQLCGRAARQPVAAGRRRAVCKSRRNLSATFMAFRRAELHFGVGAADSRLQMYRSEVTGEPRPEPGNALGATPRIVTSRLPAAAARCAGACGAPAPAPGRWCCARSGASKVEGHK